MGLIPKFKVGEYVINTERIADSESFVRIISRMAVWENRRINWAYYGEAYKVRGDPIHLRYSTTISAREERFVSLASRTQMP